MLSKKNLIILITTSLVILGGAGLFIYVHYHSFKRKLVRLAKAELSRWSNLSERSVAISDTLIKYWQSVGMDFTPSQMQSASVQSSYPWSSAFISYLFRKAGAKNKFPYSSAHSGYFQVAKEQRNNPRAPLRGFRIDEYKPNVGDLIVYSRQQGKGYDSSGFFPSHGEVVVEKGKGYVKAIGGNVGNSVKLSKYSTDVNGYLTRQQKDFFMVIQNNIN